MTLYNGFSTIGKSKKFKLTDFELIKQDLYNHFSVRKGEKLMNPNFGSIIWNLLFDPLTEETRQAIIDDVNTIAAYDPRVSVDQVYVTEEDQALRIELVLRYVITNQVSNMSLTFDERSKTLTRE